MGTKHSQPTLKRGEKAPSYVGHHATISSMVEHTIEDLGGDVVIVARDKEGLYTTTSAWLDRKFADPNRGSYKRYASIEDVELEICGELIVVEKNCGNCMNLKGPGAARNGRNKCSVYKDNKFGKTDCCEEHCFNTTE